MFNQTINDDLSDSCNKMPEGQLQLVGVINLNLVIDIFINNLTEIKITINFTIKIVKHKIT